MIFWENKFLKSFAGIFSKDTTIDFHNERHSRQQSAKDDKSEEQKGWYQADKSKEIAALSFFNNVDCHIKRDDQDFWDDR